MIKAAHLVISVILLCSLPSFSNGILQRCYSCRSRGELGSCKDSFIYDLNDKGVEAIPCASGWCGKMLETENAQKEEYGIATQRRCLQRGPSDNEERCAYTKIDYRQVFMCFCKGDLCNNSNNISYNVSLFFCVFLLHIFRVFV